MESSAVGFFLKLLRLRYGEYLRVITIKFFSYPLVLFASVLLAFASLFEFLLSSLSMDVIHCEAYNRVRMHYTRAPPDYSGATTTKYIFLNCIDKGKSSNLQLLLLCYNYYSLVHFFDCLQPGTTEQRRDEK